jgi:hypothetical protein
MTEGAPVAAIRWITPQGHGQAPAPARPLSRRRRAAAAVAWSPVAAALASRRLSGLVVVTVTLAVAAVCVRDGGLDELIVNIPALAVIWGAVYGLIRLGRGWLGVRPSAPPPRRRGSSAVRWQGARAAGGR